MTKKTIIVTGGQGFIGKHLVLRLLQRGDDVFVVDNFCSSKPSEQQRHANLKMIVRDVKDPSLLTMLPTCDEIYHLACPASPPLYQLNPIDTLLTSVVGTHNILNHAVKSNAKILLSSTSEVYGDPTEHPQSETYRGNVNPIGPRACYDEGKRAAETLMFDYERTYNTRIKVARIFNTYGPGMDMDDGRVVSNFVKQALRGEDITIYGDGNQTRSLCYVHDMVDGLIKLMESDGYVTGPINLGNPHEVTVRELATLVTHIVGTALRVVNCELPVDDPKQRRPDIKKASMQIEWQPSTPLDVGLRHMVKDFAKRMGIEWSPTVGLRHK